MCRFFSLKRSYFIVSCVLSMTLLTGCFTLIMLEGTDEKTVAWSKGLIGMVFTFWVPSPNLNEMIKERRLDNQQIENQIAEV